jgi:hypothetical protein
VHVQAHTLATRQSSHRDFAVVYETCRLLHSLGTASAAAHAVVMQCKDQWKGLAAKLAGAKRIAASAPAAADGAAGGAAGGGAQQQGGGKNLFSKVSSSASAFLMN